MERYNASSYSSEDFFAPPYTISRGYNCWPCNRVANARLASRMNPSPPPRTLEPVLVANGLVLEVWFSFFRATLARSSALRLSGVTGLDTFDVSRAGVVTGPGPGRSGPGEPNVSETVSVIVLIVS